MNNCNCRHAEVCRIVDPENCKLSNDPWCKLDNKILGMTSREINLKQGRDSDLK